jgi:hypothetical protein
LSIVGTWTEESRKSITMDSNSARRAGKQPYEAVRDQLDQLGEKVIERHWDADAPVRQGYKRFLGAMDELAGRLLDDDEIAQRGQDLLRETGADGAGEATEPDEATGAEGGTGTEAEDGAGTEGAAVTEKAAGAEDRPTAGGAGDGDGDGASQEAAADETAATSGGSVWTQASDEADETGEAKVGESWAAGNARVAEEVSAAGEASEEQSTRTVDVVFSLPAETEADHVALCGEFNDWSPETTSLARGDDRSWRVTVPLVPGTYRYKFLLDGATWENGLDADHYEDNAYGTTDSVIIVS